MTSLPDFQTIEEAFLYCRDMDASLAERLDAFAAALRRMRPAFQDAVDHLIERLRQSRAGESAPKAGDPMPPFTLPDETGRLVSLSDLLAQGPAAITFHRGHWCPYCRINTLALAEAQDRIAAEGGQIVAIMPDREQFAAKLKAESNAKFPILSDIDNGYALSLNLAIWVGEEMEQFMNAAGRNLALYQGNEAAWLLPIPATFVVARNGRIAARFIDPDFRKRMAIGDLLYALRRTPSRPEP
jgi:peroxiredoxin